MHPSKSDWLTKNQLDPRVLEIQLELPKPQKVGKLTVDHKVVEKPKPRNRNQNLQYLMCIAQGGEHDKPWNQIEVFRRPVIMPEGFVVTRVYYDKTLWMTDAAQERYMMEFAAREAKGDVLVGGLGLGMYVQYALRNPKVDSITVVELSRDVVAIAKKLKWAKDKRVILHCGEISTELYKLGKKGMPRFDTVYLDVHPEISPDFLPYLNSLREMARKVLTPKANKGHGRVYIWTYKKILSMARHDLRSTLDIVSGMGFHSKVHREEFIEHFPIEGLFIKTLKRKKVELKDGYGLVEKFVQQVRMTNGSLPMPMKGGKLKVEL